VSRSLTLVRKLVPGAVRVFGLGLLTLPGCITRPSTVVVPCVRSVSTTGSVSNKNAGVGARGLLTVTVSQPSGEPVPGVTMSLSFAGGATSITSVTQRNGVAVFGPIPRDIPKLKLSVWHSEAIMFVINDVSLASDETWIQITLDSDCLPGEQLFRLY
jgi:hypothetical protein